MGKVKESGHLEYLNLDGGLILEYISNWLEGRELDISGSAYEKWSRNLREISWLAKNLLFFQELCFM